jgi:hypothetical protein
MNWAGPAEPAHAGLTTHRFSSVAGTSANN